MKFLRIFLVILLFLTAGLLSIYYLSVGHVPLMKTVVTGNWISNILYGNDSAFVTNADVRGNGELIGREGGNRSVDDKNGTDSSIKDVTGAYSPTREVTGDDSPAGDERLKQVPRTANSATGTVTNADGIDARNARDDPIPHPEDVNVVLRHVFHGNEGQGQGGVAVSQGRLSKAQLERSRHGQHTHRFNEYVSDLISVDRELPDYRLTECQDKDYGDKLPDTSVIICFYNEAWSALLRSVHSVNNTSPPGLLREIILVDDYSNLDDLKKPLDVYMRRFPKVKIIRNIKREGLIRSRLAGVAIAKGKTLTFLDSHIECTKGWLPPLMARIKDSTHNVVVPTIDIIHWASFLVIHQNLSNIRVGGFNWDLTFTWDIPPIDALNNRKSLIDPIPSPTMIGGLFSIDRNYFYDIGSYDKGMDLWGGENLDLSFRIWRCGGRLEQVPCSAVAHLFRLSMPYKDTSKSRVRNRIRLAKVWLDDYAQYYLERLKTQMDVGDLGERLQLRKRLHCKSFDWYMKNIYARGLNPKYAIKRGMLKIDLFLKKGCVEGRVLTLSKCQFRANRIWYHMKSGQIRQGLICIDVSKGKKPRLAPCNNNTTQIFQYREDRSLQHVSTNTCLSFIMKHGIQLSNCTGLPNQKWTWKMDKGGENNR
ncbi:inactive polypeptide N-acetylgalactosaminyltransferase-like protein 5 [Haliotis rufescens]|uniref:inactive polypeptide N-acetylgalactosaminyltransferase-like protein 5 n=1 Tax=Haliotis rufescens TaxID=6454 RepID=UPI00201F88B4|nr:inactive polypeptide N-acetylgalactosaminyltransferase-like protein 5 [Haliotis rufescens]